ncbi:glutamine--fructose-6-phosphate transaminase (isomerizing) [Virgibacillus sp. W0430]|uniref:glutamine--fructose-6-phosphate transaminase (isomerizing) n=1 Tax=Virgibacillus sp. W0430 TaxID=3391580 RepID=UPI003F44F233
MCGIVGYIGENEAKDILLKGLEKLEYRGYDSAGIALSNEKGITVVKEKGRIADLRSAVTESLQGTTGIGHTRWATHGVPNKVNAHPHQSASGRFTLVHNGVIENYHLLQQAFLDNVSIISDTDTEVIAQLIEKFVLEGMTTEAAFSHTLSLLKGSYAIAMLDENDPDTIFVAKNKSPLLLGIGDKFHVVVSDTMAMRHVTDQFVEIYDKEIVLLSKDRMEIKSIDGMQIEREPFTATIDINDMEKGIYPHYMMKEMDEQASVIRKIIRMYENDQGKFTLPSAIRKALNEADRIYIIAAGTSYHAGLIGKQYFEKIAGIPVEVHISSEFGYNMPLLSEKPLFLFISQSGETADSRQVLVKVKDLGYPTISLTNVAGSTLAREAEHTLLLHAGPEIAVASTKAYTAQIAVLSIIAFVSADERGQSIDLNIKNELSVCANAIQTIMDAKEDIEQISRDFFESTRSAFFIGRNMDYYISMEGALKLKEISYIQAEGFAGGELKHGTIALIEEGIPVVALNTQKEISLNIRGNVKEVVARGANPCIVSMEGLEEAGDRFVFPRVHSLLTPLVAIVPLQLMSYYAALHRGCDVDKPRNLAKSVTVE